MKKVFARLIFAFLSVVFLGFVNLGCGVRGLEPNPEMVTSAKSQESIFTVIETETLEYPTLAASIRLPFRVGPNNTVVLARKHAYVTTERHLHVIDVSIPQRPSYLTSLAFPDEIGKTLVSGHHLVVASRQKVHLIDISVPAQPALQSTTHLPQRNVIKDMDVRDAHLYALSEDNYSLHIFSIDFRQARLVKTYRLAKRWWLLSPEVEAPKVKQFLFPAPDGYSVLHEPLLSQRGFLQLHTSKYGIIRSSNEFLVSNNFSSKATDFSSKRERQIRPPAGLVIIDACWIDYPKMRIGVTDVYGTNTKYRGYLSTTWKKTFTREKPTIAYMVVSGKMQQIAPDQLNETIEINDKTFEGPITDFQISGNLLYIVNEKGFFTIFRFVNIEDTSGKSGKVLSTTPLQASRPMSIAVGEHYVCVLAVPEDSQR